MHIKFENVQAVDDKDIFQTSRKCCKNFNQREITHSMIYIIKLIQDHMVMSILTKFGAYQLIIVDARM